VKRQIAEIDAFADRLLSDDLLTASEPWVARGFINSWPLAAAGMQSGRSALDYLESFYSGSSIKVILSEAQNMARFFYNEDLSGFNFHAVETTLNRLFGQMIKYDGIPNAPAIYLGSADVSELLPGFIVENSLATDLPNPTVSLWVGNQSRIAAHFDAPRNIACCIAGKRRFTLLPPDQAKNLYIGPWDLTPAGQPISLVDFQNPDYSLFPNFREAERNMWTVDLEVGDALYIPSFWWHQVEGLSSINGLVNFWWHEADTGELSLVNALKCTSQLMDALPGDQRRVIKDLFETYAFGDDAEPVRLSGERQPTLKK